MVKDGKIEVTQTKAEREAANMIKVGGGGGKKNRNKKKKEVVEYEDSF